MSKPSLIDESLSVHHNVSLSYITTNNATDTTINNLFDFHDPVNATNN